MEQMHVSKNNQRTLSQEEAEQMKEENANTTPSTSEKNINGEDLDLLLDLIDEVLEENAEAFVNSYIQKGGQ